MPTLLYRSPCPRDHETYNFGRRFTDLYSTVISLSSICADVEKKFLKTGQILAALTLVHLGHLQLSSPYPKGLYNEFEKI